MSAVGISGLQAGEDVKCSQSFTNCSLLLRNNTATKHTFFQRRILIGVMTPFRIST
jgi:hypothetical protein